MLEHLVRLEATASAIGVTVPAPSPALLPGSTEQSNLVAGIGWAEPR